LVSQWLTLYTTPVIYLYLDRFSAFLGRAQRPSRLAVALSDSAAPVTSAAIEDTRNAAE
jgi:hypothetical protein